MPHQGALMYLINSVHATVVLHWSDCVGNYNIITQAVSISPPRWWRQHVWQKRSKQKI